MISIELPGTFVSDRLDRDLPCGNVVKRGTRVLVTCDAATLDDMKSDAEYQGWHTDNGPADVVRSARLAHKRICEYQAARAVWA